MKRIILIIAIAVIYLLLLAGFSFSHHQQAEQLNGLHQSKQISTLTTKSGWDPVPHPPWPIPPWPPDTNNVAVNF